MPADSPNGFQSVLSVCMEKIPSGKVRLRIRLSGGDSNLAALDTFGAGGAATCELPGPIARKWLAKKSARKCTNQRHRITLVRQFSRFCCAGYSAYVPDFTLATRNRSTLRAQNAD